MNEKKIAENVVSCERRDIAFCCPKDRCITVEGLENRHREIYPVKP